MANALIQVPPDSTGKRVDTEELTVGGLVVQRQRIQITGTADTQVAPVSLTLGLKTDPSDSSLRDMGKIDVANLDQYTPIDVDSAGPVLNALPMTWRKASAGGVEFGTSTDPLRIDPTGSTTQPISGTTFDGIIKDGVGDTTQANVSTGRLHVDGSGVTQPVSGTVTANAGTGTFAVSGTTFDGILKDGTGDTTQANVSVGRLHVDGSGVTQPISVASLPLPTGAATSALQTQPGVDIGDVTINNASAGAAVNIQDGGNTITVDNGGTFATQDSQVIADNAAFTDGTSKVFMSGYIFDEVAGTALTENDAIAARVNLNRAQISVLEDGVTRARYATVSATNALKVDGSAVTQPVSGTFWQTTQPVSGTFWQTTQPISGTVTASSTAGDVAHDSGDSGNPVKIGGQARTTDPTAVASADRVNFIADTLGKQVVLIGAVNDLQVRGTATFTGTVAADIIAAVASTKIAVMGVLVTNAHATVSTKVEIRDGTTVKIQGNAQAAGGGFSLNGGGVPLFISTANTAVTARCVTTGADVDVTVSGYKLGN